MPWPCIHGIVAQFLPARVDLVCELGTRLLMHGAKAKHVSNVRLARVLGWRWAGRWECVEMVR
jgi:hypothetical protein